ncbi:MAG: proteasome assembly chaperone family protein [Promethearchaeota archaeon]|nr:MAG: proteasome assembly chaperone family protein [Candidatus Lokiarchaeota archaeon]
MVIEIVLDEQAATDFTDCLFLTGFHGLGWTGYIAIRHLIKSAETERIGYINSDLLPDIISLEGNRLVLPYEFHRYKNFIIFQPPFQPIYMDPQGIAEQHRIIQALARWIQQSHFKQALLIGGLDKRFQQASETMRVIPTPTFPLSKELQFPLLESGLMVRGPLALLLSQLEMLKFPALVLLPYTNIDRPDPAAAAVAIEFLNTQYDLDIAITELQSDARKIEAEISEIIRQERERTEQEPRDMYI